MGGKCEEKIQLSKERCEEITKETTSLLNMLGSTSSALVNTMTMIISITIAIFAFLMSLFNALKPEYSWWGPVIASVFSAIISTWILLNVLKFPSTWVLFIIRSTYDELLSVHRTVLDQCIKLYCEESSTSTLCLKASILVARIGSMKKPVPERLLKLFLKLRRRNNSSSSMT